MRKPRIFIIAPEMTSDGRPITMRNRDQYEAISDKLNRLGLVAVCPDHENEGGDLPGFEASVIARAAQMKECDMALLVPGWQDCRLASKMQETAELNEVFFHPLMNGYDALQRFALNLVRLRA